MWRNQHRWSNTADAPRTPHRFFGKATTVAGKATATLAVVATLAAGCGGGDSDDDGPIELTYWAWAPELASVVEIWNESHPDVQVTVVEQAGGDDMVTRVLAASEAGEAPDLIQAEYQALPTLISNEVVADVSEYVGDISDEFGEGTWQQVTLGTDAVWGIPQDTGPMMLYYRIDLFEQFNLSVPTTWEEFAETARAVRAADPNRYLTTFSANDPGWFAGLAQQAGATWWEVEGDAWNVEIDDEATLRVAEYWGGLVAEDVIDDQPMYTPEWNTALNDGTLLAWVSAVWGPGVLEGVAGDTAGLWGMAPLPQWTPGENRTGSWGGSSTAVTTDSDHPEEAAEFAVWLNTDPEATTALVRESNIYPASRQAQASPALQEPPEFFSNQPDFYSLASEIADTAVGVTWGPNVNVTYSTYRDAFGAAITDGTPFTDAVHDMQEATVNDMRDNGFALAE